MRILAGSRSVTPFDSPKQSLSGISTEAIGTLLSASADIVLVLDADGTILDVSSGASVLAVTGGHKAWVGKTWADIVGTETRPKVARLLKDAGSHARLTWRQLNFAGTNGIDVPLSFCAIEIGPKGRMVALGRDLRAQAELQQQLVDAQQVLERDYLRLRHLESRYRLLFELTSEGVLVVDGKNLKIIEANPAAATAFNASVQKLVGRSVLDCVDPVARQPVAKLLDTVQANGKPDQVAARIAGQRIMLSASVMHEEAGELFLLRVAGSAPGAAAAGSDARAEVVLRALEQSPDAFVVTNNDGEILAANRSFGEIVKLSRPEQALGESLDRWLGRAGVDLNVLLANLRQRGSVRLFSTTLRDENEATILVEISAVSVPHGEISGLGFTIRDIGRRLGSADARHELPQSVEQLAELVGRVPLREIVGETTELIERLCIEAALQLTQDNRATAAEILGLSRQSLYVKLRQYGIGNLGSDDRQ